MITGLDEIKYALNKFSLDMVTVTDNAVRITAFDVLNKATQSIKEVSNSGRTVLRTKDGKRHTISKEGDAPNSDSGRLIGSIAVAHDKGSQVAEVGTNVAYGAVLETTLDRPWLVPAKDAAMADFQKNVTKAIEIAIKRAAK
ncbi:MAG: hypothetical protein GY820_27890 [Gammaproteobacteria bacterium]|nr:hypothetical protein [Gammaproteobacteria bacterium]